MENPVNEIAEKLQSSALMTRSLVEWRPILAKECNCYVYKEGYICKRFDQINYQFCSVDSAEEIIIDNLYALLRFKYFVKKSDEIEEKITDIIKSFTKNIRTTLIKISFDNDPDCEKMQQLPDGCVAFRNGVYNFKENDWLFKYDIIKIPQLSNQIYMYNPSYAILWFININFEPLPFDINDVSLNDFIELNKELDKSSKNYCFELMYNMCHDYENKYSYDRFRHLCEIVGYLLLQSFSQKFVMLIGRGSNGKNSLFDGCFTDKVVPTVTANSLKAIEEDKFITGVLENRFHNIFLETEAETYNKSANLKQLTGSTNQTIENKGENKYQGYINCKHIFSANDQDKVKFSDTTDGFRRRINLFEVWYHWDDQKRFLLKGDYYDTTFSEDVHEIRNDITNTIMFIYFGMYGIMSATDNYSHQFKFSKNEWKEKYSDIDFDLKDKIEMLTSYKIAEFMKKDKTDEYKTLFFDCRKVRLCNSDTIKDLGYYSYNDLIRMLEDNEATNNYFSEYDCYISLRLLQQMIGDYNKTSIAFTQGIKKCYGINETESLYNNKPYVKCTFKSGHLSIIV